MRESARGKYADIPGTSEDFIRSKQEEIDREDSGWVQERSEAELADAEMFADLIRDALLTHFDGTVRPVHRVAVGRLLRGGSAVALLAALDAAREMAAQGESRTVVRNAFVLALTERDAPPVHPISGEELAARQTAAEAQEREVGSDAFLLYRMADERAALAGDAAGIDLAEEAQASVDASSLRALAVRHAIHFARRDKSGRAPWVEDGGAADSERSGGPG